MNRLRKAYDAVGYTVTVVFWLTVFWLAWEGIVWWWFYG